MSWGQVGSCSNLCSGAGQTRSGRCRESASRLGANNASAGFMPHVPRIHDERLWLPPYGEATVDVGGRVTRSKMEVLDMKPLLLWIAVPMMLLGASMLVAGIGSTALWIAVVTVGIALVVIGQVRPGAAGRR